jgi:hypothetical protein
VERDEPLMERRRLAREDPAQQFQHDDSLRFCVVLAGRAPITTPGTRPAGIGYAARIVPAGAVSLRFNGLGGRGVGACSGPLDRAPRYRPSSQLTDPAERDAP